MARTLMNNFNLPWNDAVFGKCCSAIDVSSQSLIQRIQEFFLSEGNSNILIREG